MLSVYQGGRNVIDNNSVEWRAKNLSRRPVSTPTEQIMLNTIENYFLMSYLGLPSGTPSSVSDLQQPSTTRNIPKIVEYFAATY